MARKGKVLLWSRHACLLMAYLFMRCQAAVVDVGPAATSDLWAGQPPPAAGIPRHPLELSQHTSRKLHSNGQECSWHCI
ncbi:hypothetical protein COO60DRAFT_412000 [Scenedesmus sp. NREL 46B-D3]|nr:hypothetical protein COO60DRAFT_412000 [Scenedesmus sp. NREL 46B-D3]